MEIKLVKNVLAENEVHASGVRAFLKARGMQMFNFMSAPGSGKTRLLEALIPELLQRGLKVGVIEGDIATQNDAKRLEPLGIPIAQINTERFGGGCHLAANVVMGALKSLDGIKMDICIIENVGNLVCPAEFDTGAIANIVLISVTEGEDKPLKYPLAFRRSQCAVVSKLDLAQAAEADVALLKKNIRRINMEAEIIETSAKSGMGITKLAEFLSARR